MKEEDSEDKVQTSPKLPYQPPTIEINCIKPDHDISDSSATRNVHPNEVLSRMANMSGGGKKR